MTDSVAFPHAVWMTVAYEKMTNELPVAPTIPHHTAYRVCPTIPNVSPAPTFQCGTHGQTHLVIVAPHVHNMEPTVLFFGTEPPLVVYLWKRIGSLYRLGERSLQSNNETYL